MKSPDPSEPKPLNSHHTRFERQVSQKSKRKVQARQEGDRSIWAGLGLFGMVGWSVMIPTLLGIALGIWIDKHFPSPYSWTLMLLFVGVVLGCWNAWYWIQKEQRR
ncbi:MAG TPA: AtpZ/AtpI family protein [Leptolyngbyaceae cyanobacterium M33_DOE_097]|uniref:ATP synthase subunit n=1 Tax=Oscillatoriales cyanobacterium SpSt-418 TaxID=2282169 RepID=A0A7C3PGK6_9CYAN|nr:AtpZ/AtpI family protein [Leptolyngbyaceae cyanobacterium M33_DOE_097]